jgi:hypothetical protein
MAIASIYQYSSVLDFIFLFDHDFSDITVLNSRNFAGKKLRRKTIPSTFVVLFFEVKF